MGERPVPRPTVPSRRGGRGPPGPRSRRTKVNHSQEVVSRDTGVGWIEGECKGCKESITNNKVGKFASKFVMRESSKNGSPQTKSPEPQAATSRSRPNLRLCAKAGPTPCPSCLRNADIFAIALVAVLNGAGGDLIVDMSRLPLAWGMMFSWALTSRTLKKQFEF